MRIQGSVTDTWWLGPEPVATNHFLPGHLRVHFTLHHFNPMQLQSVTLSLTRELNRMNSKAGFHILRVGRRGRALKFAGRIMYARSRFVKQARTLGALVDQAMMEATWGMFLNHVQPIWNPVQPCSILAHSAEAGIIDNMLLIKGLWLAL